MLRLLTIPTLFLFWVLLIAGLPLWFPLALVVGAVRRRRFVGARMGLFLIAYCSMELVGLALMAGAFLIGRANDAAFHHRLQWWWASSLFRAMSALLQLKLRIEGDELLAEGPYLLLMRHSSMADTLVPAALISAPHQIQLRYVLKKELLVDPCLDVAGNRLPNHFLDRASPSDAELESVAALARDLGPKEAVLIYPEGTRFSQAKRERRLARMSDSPRKAKAEALTHTLAPKTRGVTALRAANPDLDVVFCSHHGFEGFATLGDIFSGGLVGATLSIQYWREPSEKVPQGDAQVAEWLFDQWSRVDAFIGAHESACVLDEAETPAPHAHAQDVLA